MSDAVGIIKTIKRAALEAVDSSKPVTVYFGQVVSASPLQINVEQKMILGGSTVDSFPERDRFQNNGYCSVGN